jgi:transcriptional regulator with XRE-family HTH domain
MNDAVFLRELGSRLKGERKRSGLSQDALGTALGMLTSVGHSYVSRLESGKLKSVSLLVVVHYLQVCKAPIGKFMLELAQSGVFGEAEQGLTIAVDGSSSSLKLKQEMRAKMRYEKQREREARDADIIAGLWREVLPAIQPLLPRDPTVLLSHYLEGVRTFYRAWKLATRGAMNRDPTLDVQMAFDRIEQVGAQRLVPAAVHKMREIVFGRLMAMMPQGGNL